MPAKKQVGVLLNRPCFEASLMQNRVTNFGYVHKISKSLNDRSLRLAKSKGDLALAKCVSAGKEIMNICCECSLIRWHSARHRPRILVLEGNGK